MNKTIRFLLFPLLFLGSFSIYSYAEIKEREISPQHAMQQLYQEGEAALRTEKWDEALRKLQLLTIRYPDSSYTEKAELSIIMCYTQKKEFTRAAVAVDAFIRNHPQSEWLEYVLQLRNEIEKQNTPSIWGYVWRGALILIGVKFVVGVLASILGAATSL